MLVSQSAIRRNEENRAALTQAAETAVTSAARPPLTVSVLMPTAAQPGRHGYTLMSVYGEGQVPAAPVAVIAPRTKRYWSRSGLLYISMVTLSMALALGSWSTWTSADAGANGTWAQSTRFFMYTGLAWGLFFIAFSGPFSNT